MKIHLNSFDCQFDLTTEKVTVIRTSSLNKFMYENLISAEDFNPEFVSENFKVFVFLTEQKNWKNFVNAVYRHTETKIELHHMDTPEDFDIYRFYNCDQNVINYILYPELRNSSFLRRNSKAANDRNIINNIYSALENPKKSKVNSIYKLKMLLNELNTNENNNFPSGRRFILNKLSNFSPKLYAFVYDIFLRNNKFVSNQFKTDYILSDHRNNILPF
jgi:hypothetical protein